MRTYFRRQSEREWTIVYTYLSLSILRCNKHSVLFIRRYSRMKRKKIESGYVYKKRSVYTLVEYLYQATPELRTPP